MSRLIEMVGRRFGRLICVSRAPSRGVVSEWNCVCDCGGTKTANGSNLRRGLTASCGCLHKEATREANRTHGKSYDRIYCTWQHMLARCSPDFPEYGARGITVCDEWKNSFDAFYADMSEPPTRKHTLDRQDVNGNYTKSNCRWATYKQQARNTRANRLVTFDKRTLSLAEHCERQRLTYSTVLARIDRLRWPIDKALSTSIRTFQFKEKPCQ